MLIESIKCLHEIHRRRPHFDTPLFGTCILSICTPPDGPEFGRIAGSLPGLPAARRQGLDTVCCTQALRIICTISVQCKLGGDFPLLYSAILWSTMRILRHVVGVEFSCFSTLMRICLIISFVVSSRALMSCARITLLSLALLFLRLSMAACTSFFVNSGISFFSSSSPLLFLFEICEAHALLRQIVPLHTVCCGTHRRHWQFLFLK